MDHNKVIAKQAKLHLKPIGYTRSGKSRLWYKDKGWWGIVIEFQPSSFSKGTYVNVSVSYFLYEKSHWTFDVSSRVGKFISVENSEDFEKEIIDINKKTISRAEQYLKNHSSVSHCNELCCMDERQSVWDLYHSSIFSSFLGDWEGSENKLHKIIDSDYDRDFEIAVQHRAADLLYLQKSKNAYKKSIYGIVLRTRNQMHLDWKESVPIVLPWE